MDFIFMFQHLFHTLASVEPILDKHELDTKER